MSEHPDALLFHAPGVDSRSTLRIRAAACGRRVRRLAAGMQRQLGLEPGTKVAILVDSPVDLVFVLHAVWLAGCTAVPLDIAFSDDVLISLINNTGCSVVVFPLSASARIASLFGSMPGVSQWIVAGASTTPQTSGSVLRLEQLMGAMPEDLVPHEDEESDALVVLSRGFEEAPHGIALSHRALFSSAVALGEGLSSGIAEGSILWSLLPAPSLPSILIGFVLPLVSPYGSCLAPFEIDEGFWDSVQSLSVQCAVLDQDLLRMIRARGKSRRWSRPEHLSILLAPTSQVSESLVRDFERTYQVPVWNSYLQTECGGFVTLASPQQRRAVDTLDAVAAAGRPLPGVRLGVRLDDGAAAAVGVSGEIIVQSAFTMSGYDGSLPGDSSYGANRFLHTGDIGRLEQLDGGGPLLVVQGRARDLLQFNGDTVHLGQIESLIYQLSGVRFARAVKLGSEEGRPLVGVYVVPTRPGAVLDREVLEHLAIHLPYWAVPRVLEVSAVRGRRDGLNRADVVQRLMAELSKE